MLIETTGTEFFFMFIQLSCLHELPVVSSPHVLQ